MKAHDSETAAKAYQLSAKAEFSGWGVSDNDKFQKQSNSVYSANSASYTIVCKNIMGSKESTVEPELSDEAK